MKKYRELYLENGKQVGLDDVIVWWLHNYKGIEHLTEGGTSKPEIWYTINTILERCFKNLANHKRRIKSLKPKKT